MTEIIIERGIRIATQHNYKKINEILLLSNKWELPIEPEIIVGKNLNNYFLLGQEWQIIGQIRPDIFSLKLTIINFFVRSFH